MAEDSMRHTLLHSAFALLMRLNTSLVLNVHRFRSRNLNLICLLVLLCNVQQAHSSQLWGISLSFLNITAMLPFGNKMGGGIYKVRVNADV